MKKRMHLIKALALTLMVAMPVTIPAVVYAEETHLVPVDAPKTLYVNKEEISVYDEPDTNSQVQQKLRGATDVSLEGTNEDGTWDYVNYRNEAGGTSKGWVEDKDMVDYYPQSLCPHQFGEYTVTQQPTCTDPGYETAYCTLCGIMDEREIAPLGHTFGDWAVTKEATCVDQGERTRTCTVCGAAETETFLADHTFGDWTVTKEATCTEAGERTRKCTVCGTEDKQAIDKIPHDFENKILVEPTDHSAGKRTQVCKKCGYTTEEQSFDPDGTLRVGAKGNDVYAVQQMLVEMGYLNAGGADGIFGGGTEKAVKQFQQAQGLTPDGVVWPQTRKLLNHDFGPWKTVKEMTRAEAGERVRTCKDCGFEQHEAIEPGVTYERGARGEEIRCLQQIIKQVGFDAGSFDGIYGEMLDKAMADFAEKEGIEVESGKIRPVDVDALVNAWFKVIGPEELKGEGVEGGPVNLALTVTANEKADDSDITTYNWSVTNLGTEKAIFTGILLAFGDELEERPEVMVMVLDGEELAPNAGNSVSGKFFADSGWGTGALNFAALGATEADGGKWLSNTVVFENLTSPGEKTIEPVSDYLDVNNLPDGIYPVSFNPEDVVGSASGIYMNGVHVYTEDWYDLVDVNHLAEGDTIVMGGNAVPVLSIERGDVIKINDGQDAESFNLVTEENSNGFIVRGLDDMSSYTERGVTSLQVSDSAVYTDSSNPEGDPVTADAAGIVEAIRKADDGFFTQFDTTIRVEAGKVVEINRTYRP